MIKFDEIGETTQPDGQEFDCPYCKKPLTIHKGNICFSSYIRKDDYFVSRNVTQEMRYEVLKRQKWRCNMCNTPLKYNKYSNWMGKIAHIDHIHPFSERFTYPGGIENINQMCNLQALCPDCNFKKGKGKS